MFLQAPVASRLLPLNPSQHRLALIAFQINTALIPSWLYCHYAGAFYILFRTKYCQQKVLRDGDFHLLRFWLALFWFVGDLVSLSCSLGTHAIFSSSLPSSPDL